MTTNTVYSRQSDIFGLMMHVASLLNHFCASFRQQIKKNIKGKQLTRTLFIFN